MSSWTTCDVVERISADIIPDARDFPLETLKISFRSFFECRDVFKPYLATKPISTSQQFIYSTSTREANRFRSAPRLKLQSPRQTMHTESKPRRKAGQEVFHAQEANSYCAPFSRLSTYQSKLGTPEPSPTMMKETVEEWRRWMGIVNVSLRRKKWNYYKLMKSLNFSGRFSSCCRFSNANLHEKWKRRIQSKTQQATFGKWFAVVKKWARNLHTSPKYSPSIFHKHKRMKQAREEKKTPKSL